MDISALGTQYLNNTRFTSPFAGLTRGVQSTGTGSGGNTGFADILEKAKMDKILSAIPDLPADTTRDGVETAEPTKNRTDSKTEIIPAANRKPVIDKTDPLYEQCQALETFLTKTLISGMRGTVQKTGLIDDSFAGKMYEDMLYDEYAKTYTENANFGLADLAYLELTGQRGKVISR
jgi:flagellar protein FlgJ